MTRFNTRSINLLEQPPTTKDMKETYKTYYDTLVYNCCCCCCFFEKASLSEGNGKNEPYSRA